MALLGCSGPEPCPDVHADDEILVPETNTTLTANARISAHTDPGGSGGVTASFDDNQGTISFFGRGPLQAFIYRQQPYDDAGSLWLSGLAIDDGAWLPFWLYCSRDGRLTDLYGERTDRSDVVFPAISGTCTSEIGQFSSSLRIPAHSLRQVAMTCGYSAYDWVTAPEVPVLDLGSSRAGTMLWGGNQAKVFVFATVNCQRGCWENSWYELHSIVWDPSARRVGLGLFYIYVDGSLDGVTASFPIELPAAISGSVTFPTAAWSLFL
jgi:hypothetical protein